MHANTEQLLLIKDSEPSQYTEHLQNCNHCQKALLELTQIQSELQKSSTKAPSEMWNKIQSEYHFKQTTKHSSGLIKAIYTLAASILLTGSLVVFSNYQQSKNDIEQYDNINQLMLNSSALETSIAMHANNEQINSDTRYQNEKLQWRLMLIDQKLQSIQTDDLANRIILWQDRIRALRDLKQNMNTNNTNQQL